MGSELLYNPEERARHGKALDALTDQQYAFVQALAEQQLTDPNAPKRAAAEAGYTKPYHIATLMRNPQILAAIHEMTGTRLRAAALASQQAVEEILADPSHKDRGKTARWVLELSGFTVEHQQKITVDHQGGLDANAMRAELARLLAVMPQGQRLLTAAGLDVIDAEFEPVKDKALAPDGQPW